MRIFRFPNVSENIRLFYLIFPQVRGFDQVAFPEDTKKGGKGVMFTKEQPYQFADPCPPSMRQVSNTLIKTAVQTHFLNISR